MNLNEAERECKRWFAYLEKQREKSLALQNIAARVRSGQITPEQGRKEVLTLDSDGLLVYDGSKLEQAVKFLLKAMKSRKKEEKVNE